MAGRFSPERGRVGSDRSAGCPVVHITDFTVKAHWRGMGADHE